MASQAILNRLQAEFDSPPEAIAVIVARLEEGAPPAYLSHFCRHEIGNIGEGQRRGPMRRWNQRRRKGALSPCVISNGRPWR